MVLNSALFMTKLSLHNRMSSAGLHTKGDKDDLVVYDLAREGVTVRSGVLTQELKDSS